MIRVDAWLEDPAAALSVGAFDVGALIRLERSATQSGAYAEITTIAIVATTAQYTYWDTGGDETSWYRYRVSTAANTNPSPYSAPFQGTSPTASLAPVPPQSYAPLAALLSVFETVPVKAARLTRFGHLLTIATGQVIDECGHRDYFRHPASGSATWVEDGNGSDTLHLHEGLVALDTLELSFNGGLSYVPVTATDYVLRGDSPYSAEPIPTNEPYFHVRFTGFGQYTNFPPTVRSARLTGARGWPAIPISLSEATAQRARQLAYAEGSYSGSNAGGPDEYGPAATTDRFWPQSMWNFLKLERGRFRGCHIGGTMTEPVSARSYR